MRINSVWFGFVMLLLPGAVMAAPVNDNYVNSLKISGFSGKTTGTNTSATAETKINVQGYGTPLSEPYHCGTPPRSSVWWSWTAPSASVFTTGTLTIDTIGSDFDTRLAVYHEPNSYPWIFCDASDDDSGGNNTSRVTFTVMAGVTYRIAVDGFSGAQGSIVLNWNLGQPTNPTPPTSLAGQPAIAYTVTQPSRTLDGRPTVYVYRWTSDGGDEVTHGPTPMTTDVLVETEKVQVGETWTVMVTPFADGVGGPSKTAKYKLVSNQAGVISWSMYP